MLAVLVVFGVTAFVAAVDPSLAGATHFRAAGSSWSIDQTYVSATQWKSTLHVSESWRWSYPFSTGSYPALGSTVNTGVTVQVSGASGSFTSVPYTGVAVAVDQVNDSVVVDADLTIYLPEASAPFTASLSTCCRLSSPPNINSGDSNILLTLTLDPRVVHETPEAEAMPIVDCAQNALCSFTIPATNDDGLTMRYRLASLAESGLTAQPGPPKATYAAAVDATTGRYTWDTTGATLSTSASYDTDYSTQVVVDVLNGATVVSSMPYDFLIRIKQSIQNTPNPQTAPTFSAATPADGTVIPVAPGATVTLPFGATDPQANQPVTLGVVGKPADATFTTTAANPATGTMTWTAYGTGDHAVVLTAVDNYGLGATPRTIFFRVGDDTCAPGSYSATGHGPCTPAPKGSYVPGPGATSATLCARGTYSDVTGASACTPAPPGSYAYGPSLQGLPPFGMGATSATPCAAGSWQDLSGGFTCNEASLGSYVPAPGATTQIPCPAGTYTAASSTVTCTPAPAGKYVPSPGQTAPTPCPAGSYSDSTGASACTPAPKGSIVPGTGATTPTPCPAGSYTDATGATTCTPAPAGSYVPTPGAPSPTPCPAGSYADATGVSTCTPAPAGSFVPTPGSPSPTPCPPGFFSGAAQATSCDPAPVGSFVPGSGATQPTPCPQGFTTTAVGASECSPVDTTGTVVTVTSSVHGTAVGQSVTFTVLVSIAGVVPRDVFGNARFYVDGALLATKPVKGGKATLASSALHAGSPTITAVFDRGVPYASVTSNPLGQYVVQAASSLTLSASMPTPVYGQRIKVKLSFSRLAPAKGPASGGTVEFFDDGVSLGSAPVKSGAATLAVSSALSVGDHSITAVFSGSNDDEGGPADAPLVLTVAPAPTTLGLSSNTVTPRAGQSVTIKATVKPVAPAMGPIAEGAVLFYDNGQFYGSASIVKGVAALPPTRDLSVGDHLITAIFHGTPEWVEANSERLIMVSPASTTTALTSSAATTSFGHAGSLTATVKTVAPGYGVPTGSATFSDGGVVIATVGLSSTGKATLPLSTLSVGGHTITVSYDGTPDRDPSTSPPLIQTIT